MDMAAFAKSIGELFSVYRFSVVSWFRSERRNKQVGGHVRSQHMRGTACDVILDDREEKDSFMRACSNRGLLAIDEDDHIHVQADHRKEVSKNETSEQKAGQ